MKRLNEDLKNHAFKQIYLLYGEEAYLKKQYKNRLKDAMAAEGDSMNYTYFEGKDTNVKEVIDLAETMPFFAERRVIMLQNTGFFKNACPELADYLNAAGFQVTQATVSRDIRDLKLTKVPTNSGRQKYIVLQTPEEDLSDKYRRVLQDGFISMDMAQNILVIKTVPGMAMAVAASLDAMKWHEVVGCIAGDDTIMCAVRSVEETTEVMENISRIVFK